MVAEFPTGLVPAMATREARVAVAAYLGVARALDAGRAVVLLTPEAPGSPMLNRICLGTDATVADLDRALTRIPNGTTFYVTLPPETAPSGLESALVERGLEPGWGWMAFRRGVEPTATPSGSLQIAPVGGADEQAAFARIVRDGYDLPMSADAAIRRAFGPWECFLAWDGATPIGAAGLFAHDGVGYLGLAATLPAHRGQGAQSALLGTRIRRAAELGCDVVATETGELRDGLPSNSYRNLLRAGFEEVGVAANWLGRR
jgi:GNAT superfamily N-acetyltransferase